MTAQAKRAENDGFDDSAARSRPGRPSSALVRFATRLSATFAPHAAALERRPTGAHPQFTTPDSNYGMLIIRTPMVDVSCIVSAHRPILPRSPISDKVAPSGDEARDDRTAVQAPA